MTTNITLFAQIVKKLERNIFSRLVKEKQTDKYQKGFNSRTHLISMVFCQLANTQSVRDINNGLKSATGNLNHQEYSRRHQNQVLTIKTHDVTIIYSVIIIMNY